MRNRTGFDRTLWFAACALLVLAAGVLRVGALQYTYYHPDEIIAVQIGQAVAAGSLDTNWKLADLPSLFKVPQYNFSGYLLAAGVGLRVAQGFGADSPETYLWVLRLLSALMGAAAAGLACWLGARLFGRATGLSAAFLVAVQPLLVQDSTYARPETFVTLLTLAAILSIASGREPRRHRLATAFASFVTGVLVATKISLVVLLPLLFLGGVRSDGSGSWISAARGCLLDALRNAGRRAPLIGVCVVLGYVAGAPYALVHLDDLLGGIRALSKQYAGTHWPHGLPDEGMGARLRYALAYFSGTSGALLGLSVIGGLLALVRRQFFAFAVFAVAVATFLRFATLPVFFERNLSHVVPLLLIFAAWAVVEGVGFVARGGLSLPITVLALALAAGSSLSTTRTLRFVVLPGEAEDHANRRRAALERQWRAPFVRVVWAGGRGAMLAAIGPRCGPVLVEVATTGDKWSANAIEELKRLDGFRAVGYVSSAFPGTPPNTLHTYLSNHSFFLYRDVGPGECLVAVR